MGLRPRIFGATLGVGAAVAGKVTNSVVVTRSVVTTEEIRVCTEMLGTA